MVDSMKYYNRG